MDPLSLAVSAVGLGMSLFGAGKSSVDSSAYAKATAANAAATNKVSTDMIQQEEGINNLKQQQMEIEGRRQQLEDVRNVQRARAMGIDAATNQGAQFGSGLQGGLAQIYNQGLFNLAGVNSALTIGRGINTFNQNISSDKIQLSSLNAQQQTNQANYQSNQATDQGIMSLGGALVKAGPTIGALGKGFNFGSFGGNFSGTPGASNTGGLY